MKIKDTQQRPHQLSHFELDNESAYLAWRNKKLSYYDQHKVTPNILIDNYEHLSNGERCQIKQQITHRNFALYKIKGAVSDLPGAQADIPVKIASQLGLLKSDKHLCGDDIGLSEIKVTENRTIGEYIPYTNHAINWHTDGYYNSDDKKIHSMILHCESDAIEGGENGFIDHELIYILLRDENPDFIQALFHEDSMIIPENRQKDVLIRPEQGGPVFSVCPWGLHMRYTARTKSIIWRDDSLTQRAVERIREIYNEDSIYKIECRLQSGEGVVSNNILHMRTKFTDNDVGIKKHRLMYRMRFYQPLLRA